MDELDSAIDWALCRCVNPNKEFQPLEIQGYYSWKTANLINFPKVIFVFKFDKQHKTYTLISIKEITSDL